MTDTRQDDRERMVETQLAARGITDEAVLRAMREIPRDAFVPPEYTDLAYTDEPLPIGEGATISQPYIVAYMLQLAGLRPDARVLDVGTGSGYVAALLDRIAGAVYTIENQQDLARSACERLRDLGHADVRTRCGDGSLGWPEAAPFDAILVGAGARQVPEALRRQLAVGGRLLIPVGEPGRFQTLMRITRAGEDVWKTEMFGMVSFVPLVQTGDPGEPAGKPGLPRPLAERVREAATPLPAPDDPAFAERFDALGSARLVLLGEASHGTSEFYRARAAITRRLVERHGFRIVAVEADWPDAAVIDRLVRRRPAPPDDEPPFQRFPAWMWRNTDVADFVSWLRGWNDGRPAEDRAGFHGLDLYSLHGSIGAVLTYLQQVDPETARIARERYGCFTPWQDAPERYGASSLGAGHGRCERQVLAMLDDILRNRMRYAARDGEAWLDAARNASLVAAAERYYRAMYQGSAESWNLRDRHMFDTLCAVLESRGPDAKAVVWAHNSHLGDARATEMGHWGELNLGQLCRERFGDAARLVGFGTDRGTVAAAHEWDDPMQVMDVRPALPDSIEGLCRETGLDRFLLDLREGEDRGIARDLLEPRLERAIGVIYRPMTERQSHYFESVVPRQFDHYIWFAETRAVTPLQGAERGEASEEETWPFGV